MVLLHPHHQHGGPPPIKFNNIQLLNAELTPHLLCTHYSNEITAVDLWMEWSGDMNDKFSSYCVFWVRASSVNFHLFLTQCRPHRTRRVYQAAVLLADGCFLKLLLTQQWCLHTWKPLCTRAEVEMYCTMVYALFYKLFSNPSKGHMLKLIGFNNESLL